MEPEHNLLPTKSDVRAIPEGFHTVTPFLMVDGAAQLIKFIEQVFDGEITLLMKGEGETVMHATMRIGDSTIMLSDASEKYGAVGCMLHLYVEDMDTVYNKAIAAGGVSLREPTNEFYGDRSAGIRDAWNNQWWIATRIEDVSEEEMQKRMLLNNDISSIANNH